MSARRILGGGAAALIVLIVLAILTHSESKKTPSSTLPPTAAGVLRAHVAAGNLTLDGPVRDAGEKKDIEAAAAARFGGDNVLSRLQVVPTADSAAWFAPVMKSLPRKGAGFGAVDIVSTRKSLTVRGSVPSAAAGHTLLAAVDAESGRKAVDKLQIIGEGAGGTLQKAINDAVAGRTVAFQTGSAAITKAGQNVLKSLIPPLVASGPERVVVGGHTDNVGDPKANLRLSRARAHSVVVWLEKHGVSPSRLVVKGYGETKPIAPNTTEAGRRKNRRIEFTVLSG
ncbi:MAG: OmpA-OmpF porin, family [Gaiellales bacterium]|nr:OmpA-OmpF porin, family [Gaiellales bacterium]